MWFVLCALAGLTEARPYGPVQAVDVQVTPLLPVPADLVAYDDRVWRLDRQRVLVLHRDGTLERLPVTDATLWLGPPGFPNLRRRGTADPRIVLKRRGATLAWNVGSGALEPLQCGGDIAPYGWSEDCRELHYLGQRLTPAKYSRIAVSGGRLWVFGGGQLQVFADTTRQPRMPGPIVHLSHDAATIFIGVPAGVRAIDASTGETRWSLPRLTRWLAPSPDGSLVAMQTEHTLLLVGPDGGIEYALEHLGDAVFAWTAAGDLVGVNDTAVVRFTLSDGKISAPAPPSRVPDALLQPGVLSFQPIGAPPELTSVTVDGLTEVGLPRQVRVSPVDRTDLERPADVDLVFDRSGLEETVRVLRPEPAETREVRLEWKPLRLHLEQCSTDCDVDLGPRLVGSEVSYERDRWRKTAIFLGEPWSIAP